MSDVLPKYCDNTSVGVIIKNQKGEIMLIERALGAVGNAPPAGHIDQHGTPEQAAIDEVREEVGLIVSLNDLRATPIHGRRTENKCRRIGGDHHAWSVYEADKFEGRLQPSPDETKGANWYSPEKLQELADRTKSFQAGKISQGSWESKPGLEEIWLVFLTELGYVS
jgi:8-oxo-dGTP pyrophosphatase MutT (NUDIX family)